MSPKLAQLVKNHQSEFDFMDRSMRHAAISKEGYSHSITYSVSPSGVDDTYIAHFNIIELKFEKPTRGGSAFYTLVEGMRVHQ